MRKRVIKPVIAACMAAVIICGCAGRGNTIENNTPAESKGAIESSAAIEEQIKEAVPEIKETDLPDKPEKTKQEKGGRSLESAWLGRKPPENEHTDLSKRKTAGHVWYPDTLSAEKEREMILSMNGHFLDAVIKEAVNIPAEEINIRGYGGMVNIDSIVMEAAEKGLLPEEDARLYVLSGALYADSLRRELHEKILKELRPYIGGYYPELEKMLEEGETVGGAGTSPMAYNKSLMMPAGMPEVQYAAEESIDMAIDGYVPVRPADTYNTAEYNVIKENGFRRVSLSPLSTFSIDVDTAGYTKVKHDIINGMEIEKDEVKIEEMINYFNFDYTADKTKGEPFIVSTDYTSCPWNEDHKLLRVGIKADEITEKPATNFVIVADVSGSMLSVNKLPLALSAYADMVEGLDENDKISIMYYASGEGVILDGESCENREKIYRGLARTLMNAGGGTHGELGLTTAYRIAKDHFIKDGVNRVLLATDGDFNIGRTGSGEMKEIAEKGSREGIYLTILGYGFENLKDNKMETMAENGHGNYYFIGDMADAKKALVSEADATLIPVADDVKIQVEFNPENVSEYRLVGYESRLLDAEDFENDKVSASQIGAGKAVTVLYEIVPLHEKADKAKELKYSKTESAGDSDAVCNISVRYKPAGSALTGSESILIEKEVTESDYSELPDKNTAIAASVAEFGMVLRDSEYKGTASIESAREIAEAACMEDNTVKDYINLLDILTDQLD